KVGLVEGLALLRLGNQFLQVLGRKLGRRTLDGVLWRKIECDPATVRFLRRRALDLALELLVDERLRHKGKGFALSVLEGRRLLVGHPRIVAGADLRDEPELHRVAIAGRSVELVDHTAGNARNAGTVCGLFQ